MKKAPEVLTRMRLSCCWGDNLNEKELNDVVDYINDLEQQCRKQKEVIDKLEKKIKVLKQYDFDKVGRYELLDILKEVKE